MKNKKMWLGMLAMALIFGMTVVGCDLLFPEEEDEIKWNGHRYRRIDEIKNWTDAKAYSEAQGGHLVTITSKDEQSAIKELIDKGDKKSYWLGGYRVTGGNNFTWVTGEAMDYTNWGTGEPDDLNSGQDYMSIAREAYSGYGWSVGIGQWDDEAGNVSTNGFVIEWD